LETFYEKYKNIYKDWSIDKDEVKKILDTSVLRLVNELLDETPWTLNRFFRDTRTNEEYLYDLIEGTLFEELLVLWYRTNGHTAKRIGSDADNKIIRSGKTKITTSADLEVDGKLVEVQVSRQGVRDKYHIKLSKGNRILKGLNTLIFIVNNNYFIVGKEEITKAPIIRNPCFGGKECYEITNVKYLTF